MFCRNRSLKGESLWKSNASNLVVQEVVSLKWFVKLNSLSEYDFYIIGHFLTYIAFINIIYNGN